MPADQTALETHFDEMSQAYDALIQRAFPAYQEVLDTIFKFVTMGNESPRILELGVGTGNLALKAAQSFPKAHFSLLDLSGDMLALTEQKLKAQGLQSYQLVQTGFMDAEFEAGQFDLIITSLALHHLRDDEKQALYKKIFQWLKPGGQFRCADGHFTLPVTTAHEIVWQARAAESKLLGASDEEVATWRSHEATYDHFASLRQHFAWLEAAGFTEVDCYWKKLLLAVFGGQKPL